MKNFKRSIASVMVLTILLSASMFVNTLTAHAATSTACLANMGNFSDTTHTWTLNANVQVGTKQYTDANDTYTYLPNYLVGADYVQTAWGSNTVTTAALPNNGNLSSGGGHALKRIYTVAGKTVDMYIAAEPLQIANDANGICRYTSQYVWLILDGWSKTGDQLQTNRDGVIHTFDIYKKKVNPSVGMWFGPHDEQVTNTSGVSCSKRSTFVTDSGQTYVPSMYSIFAKPHEETVEIISNLVCNNATGPKVSIQKNLQPYQPAVPDKCLYVIAGGTKYASQSTAGWTNADPSLSDSLRGATWLATSYTAGNGAPAEPTPLYTFTANCDLDVVILTRSGAGLYPPNFVKNDPTNWIRYYQTPKYYMAISYDNNTPFYLDDAYKRSYTAGQTVNLYCVNSSGGPGTYKVALLPHLKISSFSLSKNGNHLQTTAVSVRNNTNADITGDLFAVLFDKATNNMVKVNVIKQQENLHPSDPTSNALPAYGEPGYNYHANGPYDVDFGEFDSSVDPKNYYVKVFVWDSLAGLKPLSNVVMYY